LMNTHREMQRSMNRTALDIKLSGTTAVVVFVRGDDLYTANVGDSRAILATQTAKGLRPVELTFDQKPELVAERTRIEAAGGIVEPIIDPFAGPVGPVGCGLGDKRSQGCQCHEVLVTCLLGLSVCVRTQSSTASRWERDMHFRDTQLCRHALQSFIDHWGRIASN
jgi:hypothetical protein